MGKINLFLCGYCKKLSLTGEDFSKLQITNGTGKNKEVLKGDICSSCVKSFREKLELKLDLSKLTTVHNLPQEDTKGTIPSKANNIAKNSKQEPRCYHDQTSFNDPWVECKLCGEKWTV